MTVYSKVTRGHARRILAELNRLAVNAGDSFGLPLADPVSLERMTEAVCARLVAYCPFRGEGKSVALGRLS